ncbi:NACHT domain-containing protein [Streptomyces sp. 1222.5]|uniref:NACHT domain-containing protein n=1 Tax=Streptomyces sp. 1222.5 TaxID=1881026 RepID=UPI003D70E7E8
MAASVTGPVADFCAELRRLVQACKVPQTRIAKSLNLEKNTVSGLLGGARRSPPEFGVVRVILELCREQREKDCAGAGPPPPPPGMRLDEDWWKGRHAELERAFDASPPRERRAPTPHMPDAAVLDVFEASAMEVPEAVRVLRGRIEDGPQSMYELLYKRADQDRVLGALLKGYPERVRAAHGVRRAMLVHAARVILVAVALARQRRWDDMGLLVNGAPRAYGRTDGGAEPPDDPVLREAMERAGLDDLEMRELLADYVARARPLAERCPEFGLSAGLPTRRPVQTAVPRRGLAGLGSLLAEFAGQDALPPSARALLDESIASLDGRGPEAPRLADGYVHPRFRLAEPGAEGVQQGAASDKWWEEQPLYEDIESFFASHFLGLPALLSPLLVLGQPGAGKSRLTKLLKARLPLREFRPVRVELRHMPADSDLQTQLEHGLRQATGRPHNWADWVESEPGVIPVVLLDGFDELLQAGAQRLDSARQSGYLLDVEQFQRREAEQGRPLVVVVTSRTVVAHRAEIPRGCPVLRLEPFAEPEIEQWLTAWNTTNRVYLKRRGLSPLSLDVLLPHRHLAAQPLLLMLALYDADDNALHRLREENISRTELYDRLLTAFVRRQLVKDGPHPVHAEIARELHWLSVIALGMFQRGTQAVSGAQAESDLRALAGKAADDDLLFGRFFFVHEDQAVVADQRLRSYEFVHATFGEYLTARLLDQALLLLPTRFRGGERLPDDAELYALLSFTPLTDRAQVVQNLADMLDTWPDEERAELSGLLVQLFREVPWEATHRTDHPHAPTRQTRAYRDAVYSANLLLIGTLVAGEVRASDYLGTADPADRWRRHAMAWQSHMSAESWNLYTSMLRLERIRRSNHQPDLLIGTRAVPAAPHELSWILGRQEGASHVDGAGDEVSDVIRRVTFVGDRDAELLLNAVHPVLQSLPGSLRAHVVDEKRGVGSAARMLVALLTRDQDSSETLPELYQSCLNASAVLSPREGMLFAESLIRQLTHDAPVLSDTDLHSIVSRLAKLPHIAGSAPLRRALADCAQQILGRGGSELGAALDALRAGTDQVDDHDGADDRAVIVGLAEAGRSAHTWGWLRSLDEADPLGSLHRYLLDVGLPATAVRRPSAVIGLLRLALELGRTDWLAAHTAELLVLLPDNAFRLLRPADLGPLREALPEGGYDYETEFSEIEERFRSKAGARPSRP